MIISKKMNDALNQQIRNELNASFSYLAMAFEFDQMGLKVFCERFTKQSDEERGHAMKIAKYILEVGGHAHLSGVDEPKENYGSAEAMVQAALDSELTVTKQISGLVDLAEEEKDHVTRAFLKWFLDEQVEEVSTMSDLLQIVKLAGPDNLFLVETRLEKMMPVEESEE